MGVEKKMKSIGVQKASEEVNEQIVAIIGKDNVVEDGATLIVKPANDDELAKVIVKALEGGRDIAPVSRKNAHHNDILVDLSKMAEIIEIDTVAMTVKVQAGAKFMDVEKAVNEKGFTIGVRPAGADATVDQWVYTEEAGIGSYKYGTVKDSVYNVYAVDCNGELIETGYDKIGYYMSAYNLTQAYVASYGRVGIITAVTLKINPAGVTKAVAYQFPAVEKLQACMQKVAQAPSVKPLHISFCGSLAVVAFQGNEDFVDLDIEMMDAIASEFEGAKMDGADKWANIDNCDCVNRDIVSQVVPLRNLAALAAAVPADKIAGTVADRSTAVVKIIGAEESLIIEKVEELGGRSGFKCYSSYLDESTNAFVARIEAGLMGGQVEEPKDLSRTVTPAIIEELKAVVGAKNVSCNDMDKILYSHDLAPLPKEAGVAFKNLPDVIVRPETVAQISGVMAIAYKHGIAVTPRGNASWGLGGCMPTAAGIVLDMSSKMNEVVEINKENLYVKVQAGCTWKKLLDACMAEGYIIGSYPSSFPSGTIGAWISTNGMGIGSYKYGSAKDNILNSEVVVDNGDIVTTGFDDVGAYGMPYNLNQFFSGAEGTLAMLGTVTFRIYPMGEVRCLAYEFDTLKAMNEPIQDMVADASLRPLHIAWSDYMHFENQRRAACHAPDVTNLWLVTVQGDEAHNDKEEAVIDAIAEKSGGRKVAKEIAEHEWDERCYEFRARKLGVGEIPAEVIVPTHDWGTFTDDCYKGFDVMRMEPGGVIGVMVDRSTALFMPYYFKDDEMITGMLSFGFNFYLGDVAAEYGGRTTGFGVFFAWNLDNIHNAATVGKMRELKTVLDSHDVVNPGHVVCGTTRFGINLTKGIMGLGSTMMQTIKKLMPKDRAFAYNLKRFRYNDLEDMKVLDRVHTLGDGTQ